MNLAFAEQNLDTNANGGLNTSVRLRHRVVIPQIIYFRLGSAIFGSIDKVTIDLNEAPEFTNGNNQLSDGTNPLGSGQVIGATNNGSLQVDLRGNVGSLTISYQVSNAQGLDNGVGGFIPFEEIATVSDDPDLPPPVLENAASTSSIVTGNLFGGRVVNRQSVWNYSFLNSQTPVAGTYEGRVTYTASAP